MTKPTNFRTFADAKAAFAQDSASHEEAGIYFPEAIAYQFAGVKRDFNLALDAVVASDAQPVLNTTVSGGVPSLLTSLVDSEIYNVLFAPQKAAIIAGEVRKGSWTDRTALFPTVEHTVEVTSYGDFSGNGRAGANMNFPQRQSYLFQVVLEYGDLELETAALAKVNWASELDKSAAGGLSRYQNQTYFFGVNGLQNYGLLNDPSLPAVLTPGVKAAGNGNVWLYNNAPNATANEIFVDIEALVIAVIQNTQGLIDVESKFTLALSPGSKAALTTTNAFGITVNMMIKENFPNLTVVSAPQYGVISATNPQGVAGGNLVQLIADDVEGQQTVYCAFNEKMRAHPLFRDLSSFKRKVTAGSWGAIVRQPFAIKGMIGV